jgi:hypothetical protein
MGHLGAAGHGGVWGANEALKDLTHKQKKHNLSNRSVARETSARPR